MRIDAFNRVSQLYQNNSTRKVSKSGQTGKADFVEISQAGRDFQVAKAAVKSAPDIREDIVADIKSRMENGTYQMDMDALAEKLISGLNS